MSAAKRKRKNQKAEPLRVGFVMDPIEELNLATDTTFLLMLECQYRGYEVYYIDPVDMRVENGDVHAELYRVTMHEVDDDDPDYYSIDAIEDGSLSSFDLIFNRVDPPYDIEYVTMTQMLGLLKPPTMVVNRPAGVLAANEKLLAMRFPELMPETLVTHDPERILAFLEEVGGKIVLKPLDGYGGNNVLVVERNHTNKSAIIDTLSEEGTEAVVAQKWMPVTSRGDKRIILLAGEPIGAVLRMPAEKDHRANLHAGGKARKAAMTKNDLEICKIVGPFLRNQGLFIAGLDIIAGKLIEINVTSPTLIKQINKLDKVKLEERIIDFCEYLVQSARTMAG